MEKVSKVFASVVAVALATLESYPTKYDSINVDAILQNQRLYNNYIACLLKRGPCNEEGKTLREVIPDALVTGCSKCNEVQKASTEKVIKFIFHNHPDHWAELIHTYDPHGEYQAQYQHYIEKI